jgi:hypothetical protein
MKKINSAHFHRIDKLKKDQTNNEVKKRKILSQKGV